VEKLRKPLEKKAAVAAAQKTKNTGCVNRKVLLRYWMPARDQRCRTMPRETTKRTNETNYGRARQTDDRKIDTSERGKMAFVEE